MDSHGWIFLVSLFALHNVESRRQNIDMHIDIHIYIYIIYIQQSIIWFHCNKCVYEKNNSIGLSSKFDAEVKIQRIYDFHRNYNRTMICHRGGRISAGLGSRYSVSFYLT